MVGISSRGESLLERERELEVARNSMIAAREGRGSLTVVSGEAGIGKTRLLERLAELGHELGFECLSGRGGEVERDMPWGLIRQLFDPLIGAAKPSRREELFAGAGELARSVFGLSPPERTPGALSSAIYGLYWLLVGASAGRPVLAIIDDAHWIDEESLRWLSFLAPRIEGVPAALALGVRSPDPDADRAALTQIFAHPETRVLEPAALSLDAAQRLVASVLEAPPHPELLAACQDATRGNPFLLRELARELRATPGFDPADRDTAAVTSVRPQTIVRAVLLRLARLPADATQLARAVAVLGRGSGVRELATLADLRSEETIAAHNLLVGAGILDEDPGVGFVHPLVRDAVYQELPHLERCHWHDRAARVLAAGGADPTRVVPHLLDAEAGSDPWAREVLRNAGTTALGRGAPELASRLFERALSEAVEPIEDADLLLELGRARFAAGGTEGIAVMNRALEAADDYQQTTHVAMELGRCLHAVGNHPRAADVYELALATLRDGPSELRELLRAHFIYTGLQDAEHQAGALRQLAAVADRPREPGPADNLIRACMALGIAAAGGAAADAVALAEESLADGWLLAERTPALAFSLTALTWCDQFDRAAKLWDHAIRDGHETGEQPWASFASCFRAQVALRTGDLATAETSARDSLAAAKIWDLTPPDPACFLCEVLIEQGRIEEAEQTLENSDYDRRLPKRQGYNTLLFCRARLHVATGRRKEAIEDLLELGRRLEAATILNPAAFAWRSQLARLLIGADPDEASKLAMTELDLARAFGAPRAVGVSLQAAGLTSRGQAGIALLSEAVELLADSPARLESARALVELGSALRRAGQVRRAREVLREGLAAAHQLSARGLAERAGAELVTAGARPRRDALRGRDALTASEVRVARMAADGMTNAEIAQALFVVLRTVETHLTSAYRKLDISRRSELQAALGPD